MMEQCARFDAVSSISRNFTTAGVPLMTRILGLDYGTRRVGAALSDPGRTIAFPVEVYDRTGLEPDAHHYRDLVQENDVERIVVGLPLHTSGREGELAAHARTFGDWLAAVTARPVIYFDERYTTVEAEHRLMLTWDRRGAWTHSMSRAPSPAT